MKALRKLLFLVVFAIFLVAGANMGFGTGKVFANWGKAGPAPVQASSWNETTAGRTTEQPGDAHPVQRNILLIWVDHIDSPTPELKSLWLALYRPDSPGITLVPLYPASMNGGIAVDQALVNRFGLQAGGLKPGFTRLLESKDLHWGHYLAFDDPGVAELIDLIGGISFQGNTQNGEQAVAAIPNAGSNPESALKSQLRLTYWTCQMVQNLPPDEIKDHSVQRLLKHVQTDLDIQQMLADWAAVRRQGGNLCKFPTWDPSPADLVAP